MWYSLQDATEQERYNKMASEHDPVPKWISTGARCCTISMRARCRATCEFTRGIRKHPSSRSVYRACFSFVQAIICLGGYDANVITDWDAKAINAVAPLASAPSSPYTPYAAYRMMGIVHAAMFDAVNSVERRYRPYLVQILTSATFVSVVPLTLKTTSRP
jgi:hypothetical protein